MSSNQAVMALLNTDVRSVGGGAKPQSSLSAEEGDGFAEMLAAQTPEGLESVISELSPEQLASLKQAAIAAGGKGLPDESAPVAEDALAVIGQWMQLLQQDAATTAEGAVAGSAGRGGVSGDGDPGELLNRGAAGRGAGKEQGAEAGRLNLISQDSQSANQVVQNTRQDFGAMLQRAAGESSPTAAALFGKLVEQMNNTRSGRAEESDALDGINRAANQSSATAAALTGRPVAGAAPPAGVPFGHQSWGESMVERVMWMSSQNLRSVEIQLDPAELGPLEIHIQNRGQELQVQFVSQNPGVREALEAQMHRLREMFAGQGLDQAEVTVADRSAGEQSRQGEDQLAGRSGADGTARSGQSEAGDNDMDIIEQLQSESLARPMRGLVDYYA